MKQKDNLICSTWRERGTDVYNYKPENLPSLFKKYILRHIMQSILKIDFTSPDTRSGGN